MSDEDAKRRAHEAIGGLLDDGEFAVSWCLVIDVVGPNDVRYLAHRAGGGADGLDMPTIWHAAGMLRAGVQCADRQLAESTVDYDEDEDEGE